MQHNFAKSLAFSTAQADAPWWEPVYKKAFPGLATMHSVRGDGWAQRGGVDRVLILKSGKVIQVDEKVRAKDYGDILWERWSDKERRLPGWIQKDLSCDYIAYAFVPSCRCYLFPFQQMRTAWLRYGKEWIDKAKRRTEGFKIVLADNGSYTTESIAVPIDTTLQAISLAMVVDWERP